MTVDRRAGIRDVAALAGVSQATVSRALNENLTTLVAAETRARVLAAAESLEYSANPLAVGMLKGRSNIVGLVIDQMGDAYFAGRVIDGVQSALRNRGVLLVVIGTDGDVAREQQAFDGLYARRVDGVIFATSRPRDVRIGTRLPLVLVGAELSERRVPFVVPDEARGADSAVTELLSAGHRRIGFLAPTEPNRSVAGRLCGYRQALSRFGLPHDPELVTFDPDGATVAAGLNAASRLLLLSAPTAVFCFNDRMAAGAYQAARALGLTVPEQLSIVCFDDDPAIAEALAPPLTTLAMPHFEMGTWAAHTILDLIEPDPAPHENQLQARISCVLERRRSVTGPSARQ